jgi:peptidoglycan/LPS O-acetylase OafA/YrhL
LTLLLEKPAATAANGKLRDAAIDWMRALAILYIVGFWHLHNYTSFIPWYHNAPFARLTVMALALFTVISGFLAGKAGVTVTGHVLADYYRRRLLRIYPPYLLALIVFMILGLSGAAFLPSALMLNMIVPPPPYTLWFMTMIVLFYIAAPFLLALATRPARFSAAVGLVWLTLFALGHFTIDLEDRLLIYLPAFAAGMLLANHAFSRSAVLVGSAVIAAGGYLISLKAPALDPDQSLWMVPWATSSAVFTFVALRNNLPRSRIIEKLSLGGYFLYLFHRPIFVMVLKVSGAETPLARELVLVLGALPLAIAFGIVGQRAYDTMLAWLTRGGRRGQVSQPR